MTAVSESSGVAAIATARRRLGRDQVADDELEQGELARAAAALLLAGADDVPRGVPVTEWPWGDLGDFEPSADPIENLTRAGAYLCAELDRLIRARDRLNKEINTDGNENRRSQEDHEEGDAPST